jgi:polyisoprenoid-binding protein YceI
VTRYQAPDARCVVYTFKEGLLSKVAHDLRIEARELWVEVAGRGGEVKASVAVASLRVVSAMRDGAPSDALSAADKAKIEDTMGREVLAASRYPEVRFEGHAEVRGERVSVQGALVLHGVTRPLRFEATLREGRWIARVRLHQPDFGVTPYKAMMGTLRVKAEVEVEVSIPAA